MKRILSFLLTMVMLFSIITISVVEVSAIGNYGVDLESIYYKQPTNMFSWGQCTWYAYGRALEKTGTQLGYRSNAGDWTSGAVSTPRANSVAVWRASSIYPVGHVAFVEAYDGTNIYITEANRVSGQYTEAVLNLSTKRFTYTCGASGSYYLSELPYGYTYCGDITPPGNNPQGALDEVLGGVGKIHVSGWAFDKDNTSTALEIHVYIGGPAGSSNAEVYAIAANKLRADVHNAYGCGNYHGFDADIITTKSGSQQVYVYAINIGSGNSNPEIGSKTVNINKDSVSPTISSITISKVSSSGYRVSCSVSDNVGVTRVAFPTWTSKNGQDDITWKDGTIVNGNQASIYISVADHKNEQGSYITHIYAYDKAGNATSINTGTTTLTDAPILVDSYTFDNKKAIESLMTWYEQLGLTKPTTYTETTYKVYNSGKTWEQAEQWCENEGGHLATITSSTEQVNIETVLSKSNGVQCWLGAKRINGTWTWVTGESFSYTHWDTNQPDNYDGNETYLGTYDTSNYLFCYKWNDFPNTHTKVGGFVCEIEKKYCLEHSWDSGTTTKAATCTQAGAKLFHCSKCEKTYTEEIPATGHDYEDVIILPTMESEGYTTHTCRTCSYSFVDSNVPALTGSAYYIVPALVQQNTTLTIACADEEYTLNAQNGIFDMSEVPAGEYNVYAKQKNSLRVCLGTYQTQTGE